MDGTATQTDVAAGVSELSVPIGFLDALSRTNSQEEVLDAYARWTHRILDVDRAVVAIQDPDGKNLTLLAIEGKEAIATGTKIPLLGSFFGKVRADGTAGLLKDTRESRYAECERLAAAGILSIANAPLSVHGRYFGNLAIGSRDMDGISQDQLRVLNALAKCMASYLLLHEKIETLSQLALTDPLTCLYNRRYFEDSIAKAWAEWQARQRYFSLMMIDIDHFKALNDRYGHPFGDKVLRSVADVIKDEVRPHDGICRIGGEEFAVILDNVLHDDAVGVAERLRRAIENTQIQFGETQVDVTVSLGVATSAPCFDSHDALTLDADAALYASKSAGRNRVSSGRNVRVET